MINLPNLIKKERKKQGLSANKLAKMAGCSARAITYIEKGERKPRDIYFIDKLLKALNLSIRIGSKNIEQGGGLVKNDCFGCCEIEK